MKQKLLPLLLLPVLHPATADDASQADRIDETVTVVGTRTERVLSDVAATVDIKSKEDIERELTRDIADLVRFEPGVSVGGTGDRFGLGGFTIRGVGGNRVLTIVDGIRVPEEFSFGPFLSARRDFVDVDSLQRAEIARGPISSLYGSDALGGVVAFTTKGPRDYLAGGESFASEFKGGYSSADDSTVANVDLAAGNDRLAGLLSYTRRDSGETETRGSLDVTGPSRELADPQELTVDNLVAKLAYSPAPGHELTLGVDLFENVADTRVLSDYGTLSRGTIVNSRDAIDTRERARYSLNYRFNGELPVADRIDLTVYRQSSDTFQITTEERTAMTGPQSRLRESFYQQEIEGALLQVNKAAAIGGSSHLFTYGVDYYVTNNTSFRTGGTFDPAGNALFEFFPFPTRDFPPTEVRQLAFFLQDEIELFNGRLLLTPGLRYDRFEADATPDDIYLSGNPGSSTPADYEDAEVTGKLGAVFGLSDGASVYASYSEGFRAPPYDDVNVGFTNFIGGYKSIANPELESETSQGLEAGLRFYGKRGDLSVAVFRNDYENFIAPRQPAPQFAATGGVDPADGLLTFQSINLTSVQIDGFEVSGSVDLGSIARSLDGFRLRSSLAYADGEDRQTGTPVETVEPLTAVFGLAYDAPSNRFGGDLILTLVGSKEADDLDPNGTRIPVAGYGTVDLLGYYRFADNVTLNVGVFNLTDKQYIRWADTAAIGIDSPLRFTQPGINASATIRVEL